MPYDETQAQVMREAIGPRDGLSEKKMFGGLCFMLDGNMLCGVHGGGAMFRVGKELEAEALAIDGARPMDFTKRKMPGFIEVEDDALEDDARLQAWLGLCLAYNATLPPK